MRTLLTLALVLALGLFFTGCNGDDAPEAPDKPEAEKQVEEGAKKVEEGAKKVEEEAGKIAG